MWPVSELEGASTPSWHVHTPHAHLRLVAVLQQLPQKRSGKNGSDLHRRLDDLHAHLHVCA